MNKRFTFCLILTFLLTAIATAATLNVNPSGSGPYPTIQAAINAASGTDLILLEDGTYTGFGNYDLDFGGKLITVDSNSGNPANCIIDCQGNGRAFYFHNGETPASTVQNLTIKNGDSYYGGAIECEEASPTISNCIITNNAAAYGGAIDCFIASPVIVNCIITNNFADDDGSAIECSIESSPIIYNCLIAGNNADGYGAIDCYDESSPEITNCTIANNTGYTDRGGVYAAYLSLPTIRNSILWNNGDDIYGAVPSDVNYSCIQDGDGGTGNISNNPLFKTGPLGDYYLSQTAAGQLPPDSNCVDAGGDSNDAIFGSGHSFTTRTDNVPDSGTVDMGFHYFDSGTVVQCVLITAVDPNGNYGAIDPNWPAPAGHLYNQFTEVPLTAIPDDNSYTVEKWTGADNNNTALTNVVTMDANHTVIVKFKPTVICDLTTYVVGVNGTIDSYNAEPFLKYSSITINAHPTGGYLVKQWTKETSDPCTYTVIAGPNLPPDPNKYTIIIDSNTVVTVEFMENPVKYLLNPQVSGGNGSISPRRGYYPSGMTVKLTATPDYGYRVHAWGKDAANKPAWGDVNNTVLMNAPKDVNVQFELKPQHRLTTTASSGATIDPNYPAPGQLVYEDEVVPLTATIPLGSVVDWSGTDNDNTVALTNTVTMDINHTVTVSYHTPQILHVPGQYTTIYSAVGAAHNGDKIIISERLGNPYSEWNIDLQGKIITISSEHPDDPCCVAATIIDCQNYGRAFILRHGEGRNTVIEGLTIINGSAIFEPQRPFDTDGGGQHAVSLSLSGPNPLDPNAYGGAIHCTNGASPTISNCVFKNCRAEGRKGENASYVFSGLPDQNDALPALPALPAPPTPAPGVDGQNGLNGQNGADGADGIDGNDGYNGGDGGDAYGGALYFDIGSDPEISHCKFIKCLVIGGNGGWGGLGQNGQDGQGGQPGQPGQVGQAGGPADNLAVPPVLQGHGGNGGNGGNGGIGGNGGMGGSSFGGAIYFAAQNNAIIQHCQVIDCNAVPGLGNSGGGAGNSGNSGAGAAGGAGGAAGSGREPAATAGSAGSSSRGTDGTNGSKGGDGSTNGNPRAGGIYFGDNCNIQISDTTFSGNRTTAKVVSFKYNAGNGGNGGDGGNDPASIGGNGGRGGDAGQAGNAGDGIYIGDGANGGNGGNGGGDFGRGGDGGDGSDGADVGGNGGNGGTGNPEGEDGDDGHENLHPWWSMQSYAGSNHYGHGCIVTLNDCNFLKNYTAADSGGAEYYEGQATASMNKCTFSENLATGGAGGAQFFGWIPNNNININDCTYNKNSAVWHGGAVFAGYNVNLTVTNSTFADNVASNLSAYGGGIYWDNYGYHNKTASITNSYFTNNTAGFGGGLHWYDDHLNTTTITNCVFADNYANHGGGLYWSRGAPTITSCAFKRNYTNDGGGAISSFTASGGIIKDCTITDNTTSGTGGGVYLGGGVPKLHNCLITNNSAVRDGGGIASYWSALPQITNCTIADNIASDPVNSNYGRGGGISCSYQSRTTMKDCILADNAATWGNQISIGSDSTKLDVSYSDIQNWYDANYPNHFNPDEIRIFTNGILNIDANNVIDDDPCFVQTYFLATNSPCINTGSNLASTIGLNTYTTQVDNSLDSGTVDMGHHYALKRLTLVVIGHGTVSVNEPNHYDPNTGTYFGSIFNLTAIPEAGYRVKSWTGADESPYWNINTNTVTMTTDKTVTVEFEVKYNKTIHVFGDIPGIQAAIDQAQNGDIIRIHSGTYVGTGFIVDRKTITIIGDPAHPENVIIDCAGEWQYNSVREGFTLIGDNQHSVVLDGLSIINSHTGADSPDEPEFPGDNGLPGWSVYGGAITIQGNHTVKNCIIRDCSVNIAPATDGNPGGDPNDRDNTAPGHNKGGDGGDGGNTGGAGIFIQWGNAKIINVTIENCYVFAGNAGNGATGYEDLTDNYPTGASGKGGKGGSAFGGGIYVRSGNPYFEKVALKNCGARAGNGGNGATGAIGTDGGDGGLSGRVTGAGIYCSMNSEPIFKDCKIENCRAYGGRGGNGGDGGQWRNNYPATEGGYGGLTTEAGAGQGDIRMYSSNGGAVFCDNWSRATFTDCAFIGNMTYGSISGIGGWWWWHSGGSVGDWQEHPRKHFRVPSSGAGVYCSTYSSGTFNGCQFQENRTAYNQDFTDPNYLAAVGLTNINDYNGDLIGGGGGLCLWQTNTTTITDCDFITNAAPIGGGIYSFESEILMSDCNVSNNISHSGGGILAVDSTADITNSLISRNIAGAQPSSGEDTGQAAFGTGGGIYSLSTFLNITDTTITENYARITAGGICLDSDASTIKNCLITNNRATETGGGVAALYFAEPLIQNCTIAENYVTDINGIGGGLTASYAADVIVKDTIFWANTGFNGSQIALSNGDSDMPAKLSITYSDIEDPNRQAVTKALDVVICVDTTGSMSSVLDSIKAAASDIVDRIAKKTQDYRIAVVDFKDFNTSPYGGDTDYPFRDDAEFTTNKATIQTAIDGLFASGGADWEESVYSALMHCINGSSLGNWRSSDNAKKIIILMGDAPPHDPEPNTGYILEDVTTAASGQNINIFSILTGGGVGELTATRYFKSLSEDTGGVLIESADGSKASEAVIQAIDLATLPPAPIYVEPGSNLSYWDSINGWDDANSHNIHLDPNFVFDYYLSHTQTGQDHNSPCIDKGSTTAAALDLDTYTTRIDGIFDAGIVDMGFHHIAAVPKYDITVKILTDANYPGIHGRITAEPNNLISYNPTTATYTYKFYSGSSPILTAVSDANYYVKGWYDENDIRVSTSNTFSFTVDANDTYFVRFKPARIISVSGGGTALRNAVSNAENGDTLIVSAGTYVGDISIGGKQIKLYGVNPDDPNIVNRTIIDCSGGLRGFIFSGGETANTVINGFTIKNGGGNSINGGGIFIAVNSSPLIVNADINDCDALNASGGAIYISSNSSPEFRNVNITNCTATINGGGIYISSNSNPIFKDCSIADCRAGTNGGAVYCKTQNNPQFINCLFTNNYAADSAGAIFYETLCTVNLEGCEFTDNAAEYDAGAVMCSIRCTVDVNNGNFAGNQAEYAGGILLEEDCDGIIDGTTFNDNTATEDGGAIYITDSNTLEIADCNIIENTALRGGGIFALSSPKVTIINCKINSNKTPEGSDLVGEGGGIFGFASFKKIADCQITGNTASTSGGGIYIGGDQEDTNYPLVKNCLITNNKSTRDGGGISINWFATIKVQNCTITGNQATNANGHGGGLYCSYAGETLVKDTIFWANSSVDGSQIAVGSGDLLYPLPAIVNITYSNVDLREGTDFNSLLVESGTGTGTTTGVLIDSQTINNEITASGSAKVIVSLAEPAGAQTTNWSSPASVSSLRSQITTLQNQVLSTFSTGEFTLRQKLTNVAVFSGQVTQAGLNKLMSNPSVAHIEPVRMVHPMLAQAIPLANALDTRPVYNGSGISIAIVDSGVDYTHPRLGGGGFPNSKVIGGYDTGDNDNNPMPSNEAHGTCCAGIAAGMLGTVGDYIGGVAYNAKIYALKLTTNTGQWPTDSALAAWDWCITHMNDNPANPIRAMSNSWATYNLPFNNAAEADAYSPAHTTAAQTAVNAGITILAASGNDGFAGQGISWPAAMSNVISVGAVYDTTDQVTGYSNTADILDILAPADPIYTTDIVGAGGYNPGDYFPLFGGTSSACPFAAGSVAALQSAAKQLRGEYLTPSQIRILLRITGDPVTDTKVAITKPRVNLGIAIALLSGSVPISCDTGCIITGFAQDANSNWIVADHNNIAEDPNFVFDYYLDYNSPCINAGSTTAAALDLDTYTTRIDGIFDAGIVDMGFHHQAAVQKYNITVKILTDASYPGIHGTITADPNNLISHDANTATYTYRFYTGSSLTLTAVPDANYYVKGWYDKNNTRISEAESITFTVDSNNTYFVRFKPARTISVSGGGDALRNAVNNAENGDILIVAAGTYNGDIDIAGKQIKLYGVNPDDPNVTQKVIVDGGGHTGGFIFAGGENSNTTINGFIITNCNSNGSPGAAIFIDANSSPTIANVDINDCNLTNANGGAIYVGPHSGPRFAKVHINNCQVTNAHGGAIYISTEANPAFTDCSVTNCRANGGSGGAVYCSIRSMPTFVNCLVTDCNAGINGGAIYCYTGCEAQFERCRFVNNSAIEDGGAIFYAFHNTLEVDDCNFTGNSAEFGAAVFADVNCAGILKNTTFSKNVADEDGGAIHITGSGAIGVADCNITKNTATRGGGIFALSSPKVIIIDCQINFNKAYKDGFICEGGGIYSFDGLALIENCRINNNNSNTSGGGIYISGESEPNIHNCLITNNIANRDGGGVSANWYAQLTLSNCTIVENSITGGGFASGYGGGLSCAYKAYTKVVNSIFWNNNAQYGPGISIGSNFDAADKLPAEVNVAYSDIRNGIASTFVDANHGCILNWDAGNLAGTSLTSPLFVTGFWGNYYLSQIDTDDPYQTADSPCVDAGLGSAISNGMYRHTTRTDHVIDIADSNVDMGYHYTLYAEILGDFDFDGDVDLADLALFMLHWLDDNCTFPYWCYGTDLNEDGKVDFEDYALFAENYGQHETTPPRPDPMTWTISPRSAGLHEITMTATTAMDRTSGSQVQYYFDETTGNPGATDSGWITNSTYTDTGLTSGTQYGYRVKARDAQNNETGWSDPIRYAMPSLDSTAPQPNPMTWAIEPNAISSTSIRMVATTATDAAGVEYYFDCNQFVSPGCHDCNWQDSTTYVDSGLDPCTTYTYRVKARDKSAAHNETQYSGQRSATTLPTGPPPPPVDTNAPTPNPSQWATYPQAVQGLDPGYPLTMWYHRMAAVAATDASPPVYYYFQAIGGGASSGWITSSTYIVGPFLVPNYCAYKVYTKDAVGNVGSPSPTYHMLYGLVPVP